MNSSWKVFQTDVLDVLRQYEGFFDFFERVGSMSDNSRPDAFARITRKEKKEIWVLDAKNKGEIDEEDAKRMEKYINQVRRSPVDVGLELSELADHEVRGIFITPSSASSDYESVEFQRLHQFLQRELIYTDTDRIVRDVAKMVERRELSQGQARLLNRSLEPFRQRVETVQDDLRELEEEFVGLKLYTPPFEKLDFSPPSDAVLRHSAREGVFLIDIPYSMAEAEKAEEKARQVEDRIDEKAYYVSINRFDEDSEFSCPPEEFKDRLKQVLGILSPESVAQMFEPKFSFEKEYGDGFIEMRSDRLGFRFRVESRDDVNHRLEASLVPEAASRISERCMNSRKEFGHMDGKRWNQDLKVKEGLEIEHSTVESLASYRQNVKNIFHASVNPVYSKKIAKKVE